MLFLDAFMATVLETTGEKIWGNMWRVESVSTLHTRKKLNCGKWVSLLFEINKNITIAFSIFDFNTPIHMLRHIASYTCFIITIVTTIFFNFQNTILMSSKVCHSSCTVLTMITRMESGWLSHPMFLPLVGSHGSITTKGHLKITFGDITLSGRLFVNSLSMRQKTSPLFEKLPTIICELGSWNGHHIFILRNTPQSGRNGLGWKRQKLLVNESHAFKMNLAGCSIVNVEDADDFFRQNLLDDNL